MISPRVQALEDIEAIKRLKARWWFACDTRDLQVCVPVTTKMIS